VYLTATPTPLRRSQAGVINSPSQDNPVLLLVIRELTLLLFLLICIEAPRVWNANRLLSAAYRDLVCSRTESLRKTKQVIHDLNGYSRGEWIDEMVAVSLRWSHKC
jgi:hypothetical protein